MENPWIKTVGSYLLLGVHEHCISSGKVDIAKISKGIWPVKEDSDICQINPLQLMKVRWPIVDIQEAIKVIVALHHECSQHM